MKPLLLASLLLPFREEVLSFAPTHLPQRITSPKLVTRRQVSILPNDETVEHTSASNALEKLLAKQKSEVEETERLLEKFRFPTITDPGSEDVKRSLSTAASIQSGFDYGFVSRSEGASSSELKSGSPAFEGYGPPANIFSLGLKQLVRNWKAILGEYMDEEPKDLSPKQQAYQYQLDQLTLSSDAIWERDLADGPIIAPFVIKVPYLFLCFLLDTVFEGSSVPSRFFLLETVARMPYFSYITMLHLYETLGFWRRSADVKRIHFAEEINEFNHLLIMESLGGDQSWWVRFLAQHSALAYFLVLCHLWALSPSLSYRFSELLESHAVNTYGQFIDENEAVLKKLPPSLAAVEYYAFGSSDPFYAEFQTTALAQGQELRRPGENMSSLYDVFCAIRADEGDHVSTMQACLDPEATLRSPSLEKRVLAGIALAAAVGFLVSTGDFVDFTDVADVAGDAAAEDGSAATGIVESLLAGIAGFAQHATGDGIDVDAVLEDGAAATGTIESFLAVVTSITQQLTNDEQEGNVAALGADMVETGAAGAFMSAARQSLVTVLAAIAEIIAALL